MLRHHQQVWKNLGYQSNKLTQSFSGGLSLFNLYVALSRSSGRETIRLLRDFDNKVFLQTHGADLMAEDDRIAVLDRKTKNWWEEMQKREFERHNRSELDDVD